MTTTAPITKRRVATNQRASFTGALFGIRFIYVESFVFDTARSLSGAYKGGSWEFYALSNGGFYMAPECPEAFPVAALNGYEGELSADAFGVAVCMSAFSLLSFNPDERFSETCASHYYRLRDFMLEHDEAARLLAVLD